VQLFPETTFVTANIHEHSADRLARVRVGSLHLLRFEGTTVN